MHDAYAFTRIPPRREFQARQAGLHHITSFRAISHHIIVIKVIAEWLPQASTRKLRPAPNTRFEKHHRQVKNEAMEEMGRRSWVRVTACETKTPKGREREGQPTSGKNTIGPCPRHPTPTSTPPADQVVNQSIVLH